MAENESLDLGKTPRWQTVYRAVGQGETSEQVARKARKSLYRTVRAVKKLIPFDRLLSAACNDPDSLADLIQRCGKGRDFAHLFQKVTEKGRAREDLLQDFLWTLCDRFLDQIAARAVPSEQWPNFPDLRRHLYEVREMLDDDIRRIAHKLAENSEWQPRVRPSRNGAVQDDTFAILKESLLGMPPE